MSAEWNSRCYQMKTMISFQCETLEEAHAVIEAVAAIGKQPHACSKKYLEPTELPKTEDEKNTAVRNMLDTVNVARKNFSPGEPSITKIGSGAKETIIHALNTGTPLGDRYTEHLKLLWARGKVKFDGEYYL